jgi:flavin reductase (DIM6/NTAB) family NADH-FMN oxidoreductase RutF
MAVDAGLFRSAMSRLAAGVTIVTARDDGGRAHGMTASAVTSLSLAPPMLLVCVGHDASLHDTIVAADTFGVNVLARGQRDVAERFALRGRQAWDATDGTGTSPAGLPLVAGALAHVDCRRAAVYAGGDHSIVTGVVEWASVRDGAPLCYFRSTYDGLAG